MNILTLLLIILCLYDNASANLKSCSEEKQQSKICYTEKNGYVQPFPVHVDTCLMFRGINEINLDKNLISINVYFMSQWKDPGLATSNNSL